MTQRANPLLKLGGILFIAGGAVSCLLTAVGTLGTLGGLNSLDEEVYASLDQQVLEASGGMFGGAEAVGLVTGLAGFMLGVAAVMLVLDLLAGILGLRRCARPEKYRFFYGWGIPLLVVGVCGTLLSGLGSLNGLASLVCGVVAPALYLIGGNQQSRAFRQAKAEEQELPLP